MTSPRPVQTTFETRLTSIQSPSLLSPYGFASSFPSNRQSYPHTSTDITAPQSPNLNSRPSSPSLPLLSSDIPANPHMNEAGPSRRPRMPYRTTHPGCVLCGLIASAASVNDALTTEIERSVSPLPSPEDNSFLLLQSRSTSPGPYPQPGPSSSQRQGATILGGREMLYVDDDITVYPARGKERLCSGGKHIIIVVNRHCETVYDFGPADIPILSSIMTIAERLLSPLGVAGGDAETGKVRGGSEIRVGFVGSVMKDPQSPHSHLHAHATIGPVDTSLPGASFWRRNVVFGPLNWWGVEDLRAEIRESTSNNRVKSGYPDRGRAPIDKVPDAGSLEGMPNVLVSNGEIPRASEVRRPISPQQEPSSATLKADPDEQEEGTPRAAKGKQKDVMGR